jgi:two-component system cell cycle response regulator CpdR
MARILLAEDDASMLDFLKLALEKAGHDVTTAHNGLEALDTLAKDAPFDLLLTDIVMPGMDGVELAQKATDLCSTIKVMFITGFAAVAITKNQPSTENARVLSKPFHLNDLVKQVELLLAAA